MEGKLKNRLLELIQARERRENRKIPMTEIAAEIDVSERTVKRWIENSIGKFEAPIIENICRVFDCDLSDLLYIEPVSSETKG
ncbi:MAG: helix-turn-helix transcriptional regulator [Burkholderiales bacterium]|nr:helix-turn-helix transcriptional regulator [Anaerolineae bacterium]